MPGVRDVAADHVDNVQAGSRGDRSCSPHERTPTPKIAVAVRDDLATWQKLNVVAFLTSGVGADDPSLLGEPYEDADGQRYLCMLAHPVPVLSGDTNALRRGLRRARDRQLATAIYIEPMFATGDDIDNRATVRAVTANDLAPVGIAVHGPRREVDKAFDRLRPHP